MELEVIRMWKKITDQDPIILLLFLGMLIFTALLFVCEIFFKTDGVMFTEIGNLATGFATAFFALIKTREKIPSANPPNLPNQDQPPDK